MKLAKPHLDVGLFSNRRDEQLAFWQGPVGLAYDHLGKLGGGMQQHRHHMNGSILKMNHARDPLPAMAPGPIRELLVARAGLAAPEALADPDGNRVTLVPPGHRGVAGIAVGLRAADRDETARFWRDVMQFEPAGADAWRCGDSLVVAAEDGPVTPEPDWRGPGFRYLTVQVFDAAAEMAGLAARGARRLQPLRTLGDTVRYGFVCDPNGVWIEISQRASLTGGTL